MYQKNTVSRYSADMISRTLTQHGVNPSSAFLNIYTGCVGFLSTEGLMSVVTVFGLFQQSW